MVGREITLFASACLAFVGCAKGAKNDAPVEATSAASTAATPALAAAAAPKLRPRKKVTCRELIEQTEGTAKSMKFDVKVTKGSWGKVPPALQKLPPGAEHCGAVDIMDQGLVASGLSGKELEAFYAPLFAQVGCQPFTCEEERRGDAAQTRCNCHSNATFGSVNTDTGMESYSIAFMQRGLK
jgi:hypothetical protein